MKIKEILEISVEDFTKMMTDEEYNRMKKIGYEYAWQLLDLMQDSAKLSGQEDDEEHITISAYLDYLEDMKNQ